MLMINVPYISSDEERRNICIVVMWWLSLVWRNIITRGIFGKMSLPFVVRIKPCLLIMVRRHDGAPAVSYIGGKINPVAILGSKSWVSDPLVYGLMAITAVMFYFYFLLLVFDNVNELLGDVKSQCSGCAKYCYRINWNSGLSFKPKFAS